VRLRAPAGVGEGPGARPPRLDADPTQPSPSGQPEALSSARSMSRQVSAWAESLPGPGRCRHRVRENLPRAVALRRWSSGHSEGNRGARPVTPAVVMVPGFGYLKGESVMGR
jgi:hypothetical protein